MVSTSKARRVDVSQMRHWVVRNCHHGQTPPMFGVIRTRRSGLKLRFSSCTWPDSLFSTALPAYSGDTMPSALRSLAVMPQSGSSLGSMLEVLFPARLDSLQLWRSCCAWVGSVRVDDVETQSLETSVLWSSYCATDVHGVR